MKTNPRSVGQRSTYELSQCSVPTTTPAPMSGPSNVPVPPRMTITTAIAERLNEATLGLMNSACHTISTPAMPASRPDSITARNFALETE